MARDRPRRYRSSHSNSRHENAKVIICGRGPQTAAPARPAIPTRIAAISGLDSSSLTRRQISTNPMNETAPNASETSVRPPTL